MGRVRGTDGEGGWRSLMLMALEFPSGMFNDTLLESGRPRTFLM